MPIYIFQFEELVDQFIPSDMSWKGWVKMAFQQPLIPVLPVARELISKTKWLASKGTPNVPGNSGSTPKFRRIKAITHADGSNNEQQAGTRPRTASPSRAWRRTPQKRSETPPPPNITFNTEITTEPEPLEEPEESERPRRARVRSLFSRASSRSRKSGG